MPDLLGYRQQLVKQLLGGLSLLLLMPIATSVHAQAWHAVRWLLVAEMVLWTGWYLHGRGRFDRAGSALLLALVLLFILLVTRSAHTSQQIMRIYPSVLLIAALFFTGRRLLVVASLLAGSSLLVEIARSAEGVSHYDVEQTVMYLASTTTIVLLISSKLHSALVRAQDQKQSLVEREQRLEALTDASFEGINITKDGVILEANRQLAQLLGYDLKELVGRSVASFIAPESRETVKQYMANLATDPQEVVALRKDGARLEVMVQARVLEYRGQLVRVAAIRDMTERKQAMQALKDSEQFQRAVLDSLRTCIAVLNPQGGVVAINQAWGLFSQRRNVLITGVCEGADYLMLCDQAEDFPAARRLSGGLKAVICGERDLYEDEYSGAAAEERTWFRVRVTPFPGSLPRKVVVAHEDITEIKGVMAELEEAEDRYRTLFEQSPFGVLSIDPETMRPVEFNTAASRQLGYSREEFSQLQITDYDATFSREEVRALVQRALHDGFAINTKHRTKAGEIRDVEVTALPLRTKQRILIHTIVVDVTDQHRASEQLRLQGAALQSAANGIVITDKKGVLEWVNPAFEKLTGYSAEEAVGNSIRILKSGLHPEEKYSSLWGAIIAGNSWHGEMVNRRKDGKLYYEELTVSPVRNSEGVITHFVGVKQDITQRRKAFATLKRQVQFQETLLKILNRFSSSVGEELTAAMREGIGTCASFLNSDYVLLHILSDRLKPWVKDLEWQEKFGRHSRSDFDPVLLRSKALQKGDIILPQPKRGSESTWEGSMVIEGTIYVPIVGQEDSLDAVLVFFGASSDATDVEILSWLRLLSQAVANTLLRKAVLQRLAYSELRYRSLFELAGDGIVITDNKGMIDCNPRALQLYGYTKEQMRLHTPGSLSPERQPDGSLSGDRARALISAALTGEVQRFEWVHQRSDGTTFDADISVSPLPEDESSAGLVMGIVRDINERKRFERSLQASEEALRSLYTRLQGLREEERKSVARDLHDHSGQLITAMKFDLDSLGFNLKKLPDSSLKATLVEKLDGVKNLLGETHQSLAKIATSLRPSELSAGLLSCMTQEIMTLADRARWFYRLDLPKDEIKLGERSEITVFRVFQEATNNIAKHADATSVFVSLRVVDDQLRLVIEDNGKGIPPADQRRPGALGLVGMQERAGMLGGRVAFQAAQGGGTVVILTVPYSSNCP